MTKPEKLRQERHDDLREVILSLSKGVIGDHDWLVLCLLEIKGAIIERDIDAADRFLDKLLDAVMED
jgi:hypothetical protein